MLLLVLFLVLWGNLELSIARVVGFHLEAGLSPCLCQPWAWGEAFQSVRICVHLRL